MKEVTVRVKRQYVSKLRKGYPLIEKDALLDKHKLKEEGLILQLVDEHSRFIAKGYYGRQNKGNGWVLHYDQNKPVNQTFFKAMLEEAFAYRSHLMDSQDTTAFRMFNGEGDGIGGMTIDYYDGYYLINWYSEGIYRFRDTILHVLDEIVTYKGIYEKKRFKTGGKYIEGDDFVCGSRAEFPLMVLENGVRFPVYLNEGAMVGFFLDQRNVRRTIRDKYAEGKEILNTFSYTGAFSVYGALGGAKITTSVDLANRSRKKTREVFEVNGLDPDHQSIVVEDVFNYFKYAVKKQLSFDMVILDPPSFAKSKKYTFSASKDYVNLLGEAIAITRSRGIIVASTNCSSFNMGRFKDMIAQAFQRSHEAYEILEAFSLPEDFRINEHYLEGDYLKVVFIKKK